MKNNHIVAAKILALEERYYPDFNGNSIKVLNSLLDEMKSFDSATPSTIQDLFSLANEIALLFRKFGFSQRKNELLWESLLSRYIDCFGYSVLAKSFGEFLHVRIEIVNVPHHAFIRLYLPNKESMNYDFIYGQRSDDWYVDTFKIKRNAIGAIYMKEFTDDEILGHAIHRLGYVYCERQCYDKAIYCYNEAIKLSPGDPESFHNCGIAHAMKNDFHNAIKCFSHAINLNPDYSDAYRSRGLAYFNIKQFDNAIKEFTKSIQTNPLEAMTYYNRGDAFMETHDYTKAREDFQKALTLNPSAAIHIKPKLLAAENMAKKE